MSPEQMRAALLQRYPGSEKIAKMPDKQIYAMYMSKLSKKDL